MVFLHSYFLLQCSDITSLPPFPHSSSPHVPAISIFLFFISVTMSNSPYNYLTSSFVLLLQYPATHIGPNIFLSTFLSQIRVSVTTLSKSKSHLLMKVCNCSVSQTELYYSPSDQHRKNMNGFSAGYRTGACKL